VTGVTEVGRHWAADICLPHPSVSLSHAIIIRSPAGARIVDCGSRTGMAVNGLDLTESPLRDRDVVRIGHLDLVYVDAEQH
jgi:pSer/pThr/pTyr-binding forkhead associated (FHA) protein